MSVASVPAAGKPYPSDLQGAASVATTRGTCEQVLHNTEAVQQAESLLRADARAALEHARAVLEDAVDEVDSRAPAVAAASRAPRRPASGDTEDGARIMREVKSWAEEHGDNTLLAISHRRLSALFRRVGDPALMLEHAVTAVDLLARGRRRRGPGRPPAGAGRRPGRERLLRRLDPPLPRGLRPGRPLRATAGCSSRCSTTSPTRSTKPALPHESVATAERLPARVRRATASRCGPTTATPSRGPTARWAATRTRPRSSSR